MIRRLDGLSRKTPWVLVAGILICMGMFQIILCCLLIRGDCVLILYRHFYEAGNWTDNAEISANLGQAVWITVENVNILGTTISIRENNSQNVQQSIILPKSKIEFQFTQFGTEPMFRKFNMRTNSDAFIVNYTIESTWVPGMPPNR